MGITKEIHCGSYKIMAGCCDAGDSYAVLVNDKGMMIISDYITFREDKGLVFIFGNNFEISAGGVKQFLIYNPNYSFKLWFETEFGGTASGDINMNLFENPTFTSLGSQLNLKNLSREHENTIQNYMQFYEDPVVTVDGDSLYSLISNADRLTRGIMPTQPSFILEKGKYYLLSFENTDVTNSAIMNLVLWITEKGRWE